MRHKVYERTSSRFRWVWDLVFCLIYWLDHKHFKTKKNEAVYLWLSCRKYKTQRIYIIVKLWLILYLNRVFVVMGDTLQQRPWLTDGMSSDESINQPRFGELVSESGSRFTPAKSKCHRPRMPSHLQTDTGINYTIPLFLQNTILPQNHPPSTPEHVPALATKHTMNRPGPFNFSFPQFLSRMLMCIPICLLYRTTTPATA